MAKPQTRKSSKITPEQVAEVVSAVFACVEANIEERFFLLDVAFEQESGYWYLRLYIEGRGFRVSLNDCEAVSRALGEKLEQLIEALPDLGDLSYSLEVSSPGAFRNLAKAREFEFYRGCRVRVQGAPDTKRPFKPVEGLLEGYDADTRTLTLRMGETQEQVQLNADRMACLSPELKSPEEEEPPA